MAVFFVRLKPVRHVSTETVMEFQKVIEECSGWIPVGEAPAFIVRLLGRVVAWVPAAARWLRLFRVKGRIFVALMSFRSFKRAFPFFLYTAQDKGVYFFDVWEPVFAEVERLIRQYGIGTVFFSSKRACEHFSSVLPGVRSHWVPEGIVKGVYQFRPYENKDIDVLQFGRKYDLYHDGIVGHCLRNGIVYRYEEEQGRIVFPEKKDFIEGLSRTRISVCFSSDITHPQRSGRISTMTQRYLQSMLSKCLVLGNLPDEMRELFDYEPVIKADLSDPAGQLEHLLKDYAQYLPLIERNYSEVTEKHTWERRVERLRQVMGS